LQAGGRRFDPVWLHQPGSVIVRDLSVCVAPRPIGFAETPLSDIVKRRSIRASAFDTRVRIGTRPGFRVVDQDEVARNLVGGLDRTSSDRSRSKLVFLMQCRSGVSLVGLLHRVPMGDPDGY
jgi:hypothetical protein